jgi:hypothetical protein
MDASRKAHFFVQLRLPNSVRIFGSFLWADPTRGALQVFLSQQFLAVENPGAVIRQEGIEEGIWITVDPIPGCMVCNIGESQWAIIRAEFQHLTAM